MPCPFLSRKRRPQHFVLEARLPLIDEFDGLCHAGAEAHRAADASVSLL